MIKKETQATIGRYALEVEGSEELAWVSYTRPRQNAIYVNFFQAPDVAGAEAVVDALFEAIITDAVAQKERVVLANDAIEARFGSHPAFKSLIAA